MSTTADDGGDGGVAALRWLKSTEPPLYLSAAPNLSEAARLASTHLYSSFKSYTTKSPFPQLLTDGFDAEQIWQQLDLQSQPLLASLRRHIRNFEKNPEDISKNFNLESGANEKKKNSEEELALDAESEDLKDVDMEDFDEGEDEDEIDDEVDEEDEAEEEEDKGDGGEKRKGREEENGGVEDRFFKIDELEEYMEDDEAREYGLKKKTRISSKSKEEDDDTGEEEEGDDGDEEEDDELGLMGLDGENGGISSARYEDFFGSSKGTGRKKNVESSYLLDGSRSDDEMCDGDYKEVVCFQLKKKQGLSTHGKELGKLQSTIEEMEKANLEEKVWSMQGEVTAARRPKNSALEADLDFEHNVRPAPVITEEVTASLEELIQKRIVEDRFDDVQKPPSLLSRATKEIKELDDNKSKKGLAEIYEEEYIQKTGLVSTALFFSDVQKKEASTLFKKLCLKLDALSHFHFTPKPVIEVMSIQANVPALAIEEVAPVAVSDAAMLAPQEVFSGKGDIKEEAELTQAERKRRRANKEI